MSRLSTELANLTIRLYDALRQAGVSVQMVCSRSTPRSRSKYLRVNGRQTTIRISDHHLPPHHPANRNFDLEVVVLNIGMIEAAELRARTWIEENYGSPQIQKIAS